MATELSLQSPLLTVRQLETTRSRRDGLSENLETDLRLFGSELVQSVGILHNCWFELPQTSIAIALVLFQRFFFVSSFRQYGNRDTVLGAIFLASKVAEQPRKIADILSVFDYCVKRHRSKFTDPLESFSAAYFELRTACLMGEMHILRRLGFNVHVELPYGVLVNFLKELHLDEDQEVCKKAWSYANDMLRTPLPVLIPPPTLAAASIHLACLHTETPLPTRWLDVFEVDAEEVEPPDPAKFKDAETPIMRSCGRSKVAGVLHAIELTKRNPKDLTVLVPPPWCGVLARDGKHDLLPPNCPVHLGILLLRRFDESRGRL